MPTQLRVEYNRRTALVAIDALDADILDITSEQLCSEQWRRRCQAPAKSVTWFEPLRDRYRAPWWSKTARQR